MAFKGPEALLNGVKFIHIQPLLLKRSFLFNTILNSSNTGEPLLKNLTSVSLKQRGFYCDIFLCAVETHLCQHPGLLKCYHMPCFLLKTGQQEMPTPSKFWFLQRGGSTYNAGRNLMELSSLCLLSQAEFKYIHVLPTRCLPKSMQRRLYSSEQAALLRGELGLS